MATTGKGATQCARTVQSVRQQLDEIEDEAENGPLRVGTRVLGHLQGRMGHASLTVSTARNVCARQRMHAPPPRATHREQHAKHAIACRLHEPVERRLVRSAAADGVCSRRGGPNVLAALRGRHDCGTTRLKLAEMKLARRQQAGSPLARAERRQSRPLRRRATA